MNFIKNLKPKIKYIINRVCFRKDYKFDRAIFDIAEIINDKDLKLAEICNDVDDLNENDASKQEIHDFIKSYYKNKHENENWLIKSNKRGIDTGIENQKSNEYREFISNALSNEDYRIEYKAILKRKRNYAVAKYAILTAAAIIGVFLFISIPAKKENFENVYSKYYKPFNLVTPVYRGININLNNKFITGAGLYKNGDYKGALSIFEIVIKEDSTYLAPVFFAGITCLETGDYIKAKEYLLKVKQAYSDYSQEACWYLGLCCLKLKDKSGVIINLGPMAETKGYYALRAKEILRRLK